MTHIDEDTVPEIERETRHRMQKSVRDLGHAMATIRTGRASIALLDPIKVDYYGTPTPLNQMATLTTPTPTSIAVQPWDVSQIGTIEKAIRASDLGINPANDGKIIRLTIPPLTQERRQALVRRLHKVIEQHRIAVRNIRRDANDAVRRLEKAKSISEDEGRQGLDKIQKITNNAIRELDQAGQLKEREILEFR